jgi:FtsH-binding integral membrane protein
VSTPQFSPATSAAARPVTAARGFVADVFGWMFLGLGITAGLAAFFSSQNDMVRFVDDHPGVVIGVIIAQFVLVIGLVAGMNKMSSSTARLVFCLYAATMGFTFALIFETYSTASIASTFAVTAGTFGGAAAFGWITKKDLTMVGQVAIFLLIGLILTMVVNFFVGSSTLEYVISGVGVLVFTALTAYDLQKIKRIAAQATGDGEAERKAAIFGALALYLDFINLFLFILRLTGGR